MPSLIKDELKLEISGPGPENPFAALNQANAEYESPLIKSEKRGGVFPYLNHDSYTTESQPKTVQAFILENQLLRAIILPAYGGRLWSLVDKRYDRELLFRPDAINCANLSAISAGFVGGAGWYVGSGNRAVNHFSSMQVAQLEGPGFPVLRLFDFERRTNCYYHIDFYLKDNDPRLYVKFRVINPGKENKDLTYWSSCYLPEEEKVRLILPCRESLSLKADSDLLPDAYPLRAESDLSYSKSQFYDGDISFNLSDQDRPWFVHLDHEGKGLLHCSSQHLNRRRRFTWGQSQGAHNWQERLFGDAAGFEMQMSSSGAELEPGSVSWLECFSFLETDPALVHGDWEQAIAHVGRLLDADHPNDLLEQELTASLLFEDQDGELLFRGDPWGSLEILRRKSENPQYKCLPGLPFDENHICGSAEVWRHLLNQGRYQNDGEGPAAPVDKTWLARMENASDKNWEAWLQLGYLRWHNGEPEDAESAWKKSFEAKPNVYALRNLSVLAAQEDFDNARDFILEAVQMAPDSLTLMREAGAMLLKSKAYREWLTLLDVIPESIRDDGRIRLYEGQACLALGDLDAVARILAEAPSFPDMQPGEFGFGDLWVQLYEERLVRERGEELNDEIREEVHRIYPPPAILDYRLGVGPKESTELDKGSGEQQLLEDIMKEI